MLTDGILLLHKTFATDYFSKVESFTNPANAGKIDDFFKQHFESKIAAAQDIYSFDGTNARIRINGPMSPDGPDLFDIFFGFGGVSFADIIDAAKLAAEEVDPETGKVFFDMNTPGSTVDGVDNTFQEISKLSATHHTVAVNHGMIASGGVWIASAVREISAATPVAFTGSIGVIVAGFDISEMLDKMGVKKVVITNHEASEKRADIGTPEGQKIIQAELDAIYTVFKERVLAGRKKMTEEIIDNLKGSVKVASEALNIGLIDSISGVDVVIPPAAAGKSKKEASMKSLKEFLAANPEAKTEYDDAITAAADTARAEGETAGTEKGIEQMKTAFTAALPILSSDSYPDTVKERVTAKAMAGDTEGLADFVAMHDMNLENQNQNDADDDADDDTPPEPPAGDISADGMVSNPTELAGAVAQYKAEYGNDVGGTK